jgi:hypothetical protein
MSAAVEFLLRLLDEGGQPQVAQEDIDGAHGSLVRACQAAGIIGREPGFNPAAGCPHCDDGVPYRVGGRFVCPRCGSATDQLPFLCWRVDTAAFAGWLARQLRLRGEARRVEERLWQLGAWSDGVESFECFFLRAGSLSEMGKARLSSYRNALAFHGLARPAAAERLGVRCVPLLGLLRTVGTFGIGDLRAALLPRGRVRFDAYSGTLWAGEVRLGEVPPGCKEYLFLDCLARHLDRYVPYADVKREVLRRSGGRDTTDEATFCHGLKSRIKRRYVPHIDRLLATTNKADGYRLRGFLEP